MIKINRALSLAALMLFSTACASTKNAAPPESGQKKDVDTPNESSTPQAQTEVLKDPTPANAPPHMASDLVAPALAKTTASGLRYFVKQVGTGTVHPIATDKVEVHYTGWTLDGDIFDSSVQRGKTVVFALNRVIRGWTEGVQLMVEGEKTRFWIPAHLAYGEDPGGGRPGGMLVFDIELVSLRKEKKAPNAPPNVAAAPKNATRTKSGLAYIQLNPGTGTTHPRPQDTVEVHYTGWTANGVAFDSSTLRGQPSKFDLNGVIKGWTEGLQLMVEGEKTRFWIPATLAYGNVARAGRPQGRLVFDVELIAIHEGPEPPPVPEDVNTPPDGAKRTTSGLAYRVLVGGTGKRHPAKTDMVTVHYTGWTTDGKLFDSSVTRGRPAKFSLQRIIKGWTEGVQLMVEGEKTRFWIPEDLAYGKTPPTGAPHGMLVFDVELLSIE